MFYQALRRASRERNAALKDRDFWKARALSLEQKLEARSDLYIEREMTIFDRFLTAKVKTFAITDEVKNRIKEPTDKEVQSEALANFLADKKAFLRECASEKFEGTELDRQVESMFQANIDNYTLEFQQEFI